MDIEKEDLNKLKNRYNLDDLTLLSKAKQTVPKSFKDYVLLSFEHTKGAGQYGIIWKSSDDSFEMIVINNIGSKIGETWLYKLSSSFNQEERSMLLMS